MAKNKQAAKKLIIEIPLQDGVIDEGVFETFVKESLGAEAILLTLSRSLSEEEPEIERVYTLPTQLFTVRVE